MSNEYDDMISRAQAGLGTLNGQIRGSPKLRTLVQECRAGIAHSRELGEPWRVIADQFVAVGYPTATAAVVARYHSDHLSAKLEKRQRSQRSRLELPAKEILAARGAETPPPPNPEMSPLTENVSDGNERAAFAGRVT